MNRVVKKIFINNGYAVNPVEKAYVRANIGIDGDFKSSIYSPCHFLLADCNALIENGYALGDLNENLSIENLNLSSIELGSILKIGDVLLKTMYFNEPCKVVAKDIKRDRGVLALAITSGFISINDNVYIHEIQKNSFPDKRRDIFLKTISDIPKGTILTYKEIIQAIGGKSSHLRIIPSFIKTAKTLNLPVHRILNTSGKLILPYVPNQLALLEKENVVIQNQKVDIEKYLWKPTNNIHNGNNFSIN